MESIPQRKTFESSQAAVYVVLSLRGRDVLRWLHSYTSPCRRLLNSLDGHIVSRFAVLSNLSGVIGVYKLSKTYSV